MQELFTTTLVALGIATPQPVLSVWLSSEHQFSFVEMRSVQDTNIALTLLQGIQLGGRTLRVGRPADYKPAPPHLANFVVGFPHGVGARQSQTLAPVLRRLRGSLPCCPSGELMCLLCVACACATVFVSAAPPTFANNVPFMQLLMAGQSPLTNPAMMMLLAQPPPAGMAPPVGTAPVAAAPMMPAVAAPAALAAPVAPVAVPAAATVSPLPGGPATCVLLLENMVSPGDLADDDDFLDLLDDVTEEAEKFGPLRQVVIPRPVAPADAGSANSAPTTNSGPRVPLDQGAGRIFVYYQNADAASAAQLKLHGRAFNAKRVIASFYDEDKFLAKEVRQQHSCTAHARCAERTRRCAVTRFSPIHALSPLLLLVLLWIVCLNALDASEVIAATRKERLLPMHSPLGLELRARPGHFCVSALAFSIITWKA